MHPDPDYSAAYVILKTDGGPRGARLHVHDRARQRDLRGGDSRVPAARRRPDARGHHRRITPASGDRSRRSRSCAGWARRRASSTSRWRPSSTPCGICTRSASASRVWKLLADMSPREIVRLHRLPLHHRCADARRGDRICSSDRRRRARSARRNSSRRGYPAYTTSAGWMGYSDDYVRRLCREALADGWTHFKVKVGSAPEEDARRLTLVREEIGPSNKLMIDANQRWDVNEAIDCVRALARFNLWWIEEPTSPDDVLGHATIAKAVRPVGVATGEHCANRILFKQLLQAEAIDFCQIDSCRLGGVNENLAVMLMAAKFGVPRLPACRRRRPVRARAAPVDVRLHRGIGADGRPRHRIRRPPARALRRSRRGARGPLSGADAAGLQHHDQTRVPRGTTAIPDGPMWTSVEESRARHDVSADCLVQDRRGAARSPARVRPRRSTSTTRSSPRRTRRWPSRSRWTASRVGNRFGILPMEGWDGTTDGRAQRSDAAALAALRHQRREADLGRRSRRGPPGRTRESESAAADAARHSQHRRAARGARRAPIGSASGPTPIAIFTSACSSRTRDATPGRTCTHGSTPLAAYAHPFLDRRFPDGVRIVADDELDRLVDQFVAAARLAWDAGFTAVDFKHCHGYLGHELLSGARPRGRLRRLLREPHALSALGHRRHPSGGTRTRRRRPALGVRHGTVRRRTHRRRRRRRNEQRRRIAGRSACSDRRPRCARSRTRAQLLTLLESLGVRVDLRHRRQPVLQPARPAAGALSAERRLRCRPRIRRRRRAADRGDGAAQSGASPASCSSDRRTATCRTGCRTWRNTPSGTA